MSTSRYEATRLLQHYFRTVWLRAGLKWDGDSSAEVEQIIDLIFDAITEAQTEVLSEVESRFGSGDWRNTI